VAAAYISTLLIFIGCRAKISGKKKKKKRGTRIRRNRIRILSIFPTERERKKKGGKKKGEGKERGVWGDVVVGSAPQCFSVCHGEKKEGKEKGNQRRKEKISKSFSMAPVVVIYSIVAPGRNEKKVIPRGGGGGEEKKGMVVTTSKRRLCCNVQP